MRLGQFTAHTHYFNPAGFYKGFKGGSQRLHHSFLHNIYDYYDIQYIRLEIVCQYIIVNL